MSSVELLGSLGGAGRHTEGPWAMERFVHPGAEKSRWRRGMPHPIGKGWSQVGAFRPPRWDELAASELQAVQLPKSYWVALKNPDDFQDGGGAFSESWITSPLGDQLRKYSVNTNMVLVIFFGSVYTPSHFPTFFMGYFKVFSLLTQGLPGWVWASLSRWALSMRTRWQKKRVCVVVRKETIPSMFLQSLQGLLQGH